MSETLTAVSAEATTDPDGHGRHRGGAAATEEPTTEAHGRHRRNDGDGGHHSG
ncbi:hypothetical protein [Streptomyces sp. TLI_146]|uniref:hypothetical protein n=1 Tax=Streptomyces sp. TLI_146 TaxID=1938858 RepID=UPI000CBCF4D6|nr:hypothetical protein [Streptomyces sp. TLI_146]PKV85483.1 hypothetical protein BX283_3020 [Streptomyces sp. TLI_146]